MVQFVKMDKELEKLYSTNIKTKIYLRIDKLKHLLIMIHLILIKLPMMILVSCNMIQLWLQIDISHMLMLSHLYLESISNLFIKIKSFILNFVSLRSYNIHW
jgi:hypothetical protein